MSECALRIGNMQVTLDPGLTVIYWRNVHELLLAAPNYGYLQWGQNSSLKLHEPPM
jgi:hypothetical protein